VQRCPCTVLDMGTEEAEAALTDWKRRIDSDNAERDGLIRAAHEADVNIRRISQISGVSRTTVYKILGVEAGNEAGLPE
jgi:transcriptional regulator of acetoin/glycerol metabolism